MGHSYRSYVVRIRSRVESPSAIRVDVEDLQSGSRVQVTGDAGAQFATELIQIVGADGRAEPDAPENQADDTADRA